MLSSAAWAARAATSTARRSSAPGSASSGRRSGIPSIRSAAQRRSLRGCRRSTCCSTAARKAAPPCLAAAAWRRSPSLRPDSQTSRFYESHVRRFGYDYRALGFGRPSSQEKRFEALASLGEFHGRSLLDAGCGFGDLLAWLNRRGVRPQYAGLDLCPPMIARCQERFADECAAGAASFVSADAFDYRPESQYDFVVASGIFGYAARDTRSRMLP